MKYTRGDRVQDIGSQSIVPFARTGAGPDPARSLRRPPGNKTAQALEHGVRVVACDVNPRRLAGLKGLGADLVIADGARPLPFRRRFDRILVDAPCSGTGTLARNPEIKWRLEASHIFELQSRQRELLRHALEQLAPGGLLVYSTCSLEREEDEDVVNGLNVIRTMRRIPGPRRGGRLLRRCDKIGIVCKWFKLFHLSSPRTSLVWAGT